MMEQASDSPGYGFGYAAASAPPPPPAPPPAMYELRPLSTGEILDRTFSLYRRRFWLYCGLSALAAAFSTLLQLIRLTLLGGPPRLGAVQAPRALVLGGAATLATVLLYLLAYAITQAATISAVSSVYLGHETSMGKALKVVRQKWWRYILIALWQGWSAVWVFLLLFFPAVILMGLRVGGLETLGVVLIFFSLAALAYGVVAYIRNSLAVPASVFEGLKVRAAMRRSKALAAGRKGSIFLLMILLYVLSLVAGMLQVPFVFLLTSSDAGKRFMAQGSFAGRGLRFELADRAGRRDRVVPVLHRPAGAQRGLRYRGADGSDAGLRRPEAARAARGAAPIRVCAERIYGCASRFAVRAQRIYGRELAVSSVAVYRASCCCSSSAASTSKRSAIPAQRFCASASRGTRARVDNR